jgi:ADP-ribose pyrophosphatase YjhB (NUDIX family)/predicted transcriptional regulator
MNETQLLILTKLATSKGLRYSEIKPEGVENDLFNYHLQYLVKRGWVEKQDDKYAITQDGKRYAANMDARGVIQNLFKASVALYIFAGDKILLQRRTRHPFFGDVTSIAGKIHLGERAEDAAARKLAEEAGLTANFRLYGVHRKTRRDSNNEVIEDTIYHICGTHKILSGELVSKNEFGENFWDTIGNAKKYAKTNLDYSLSDSKILDWVYQKTSKIFYIHDDFKIQNY